MNKQNVFFILTTIIVLSIFFYWFQIRPAQIRSKCSKTTGEGVESEYKKTGIYISTSLAESRYNFCLHSSGL